MRHNSTELMIDQSSTQMQGEAAEAIANTDIELLEAHHKLSLLLNKIQKSTKQDPAFYATVIGLYKFYMGVNNMQAEYEQLLAYYEYHVPSLDSYSSEQLNILANIKTLLSSIEFCINTLPEKLLGVLYTVADSFLENYRNFWAEVEEAIKDKSTSHFEENSYRNQKFLEEGKKLLQVLDGVLLQKQYAAACQSQHDKILKKITHLENLMLSLKKTYKNFELLNKAAHEHDESATNKSSLLNAFWEGSWLKITDAEIEPVTDEKEGDVEDNFKMSPQEEVMEDLWHELIICINTIKKNPIHYDYSELLSLLKNYYRHQSAIPEKDSPLFLSLQYTFNYWLLLLKKAINNFEDNFLNATTSLALDNFYTQEEITKINKFRNLTEIESKVHNLNLKYDRIHEEYHKAISFFDGMISELKKHEFPLPYNLNQIAATAVFNITRKKEELDVAHKNTGILMSAEYIIIENKINVILGRKIKAESLLAKLEFWPSIEDCCSYLDLAENAISDVSFYHKTLEENYKKFLDVLQKCRPIVKDKLSSIFSFLNQEIDELYTNLAREEKEGDFSLESVDQNAQKLAKIEHQNLPLELLKNYQGSFILNGNFDTLCLGLGYAPFCYYKLDSIRQTLEKMRKDVLKRKESEVQDTLNSLSIKLSENIFKPALAQKNNTNYELISLKNRQEWLQGILILINRLDKSFPWPLAVYQTSNENLLSIINKALDLGLYSDEQCEVGQAIGDKLQAFKQAIGKEIAIIEARIPYVALREQVLQDISEYNKKSASNIFNSIRRSSQRQKSIQKLIKKINALHEVANSNPERAYKKLRHYVELERDAVISSHNSSLVSRLFHTKSRLAGAYQHALSNDRDVNSLSLGRSARK